MNDIGQRGEPGQHRGEADAEASLLEVEGGQIVGIDTFIDPTLLLRFGFPEAEM